VRLPLSPGDHRLVVQANNQSGQTTEQEFTSNIEVSGGRWTLFSKTIIVHPETGAKTRFNCAQSA
jgi:hypothetical protein